MIARPSTGNDPAVSWTYYSKNWNVHFCVSYLRGIYRWRSTQNKDEWWLFPCWGETLVLITGGNWEKWTGYGSKEQKRSYLAAGSPASIEQFWISGFETKKKVTCWKYLHKWQWAHVCDFAGSNATTYDRVIAFFKHPTRAEGKIKIMMSSVDEINLTQAVLFSWKKVTPLSYHAWNKLPVEHAVVHNTVVYSHIYSRVRDNDCTARPPRESYTAADSASDKRGLGVFQSG